VPYKQLNQRNKQPYALISSHKVDQQPQLMESCCNPKERKNDVLHQKVSGKETQTFCFKKEGCLFKNGCFSSCKHGNPRSNLCCFIELKQPFSRRNLTALFCMMLYTMLNKIEQKLFYKKREHPTTVWCKEALSV